MFIMQATMLSLITLVASLSPPIPTSSTTASHFSMANHVKAIEVTTSNSRTMRSSSRRSLSHSFRILSVISASLSFGMNSPFIWILSLNSMT